MVRLKPAPYKVEVFYFEDTKKFVLRSTGGRVGNPVLTTYVDELVLHPEAIAAARVTEAGIEKAEARSE
jgi:hypothetical protein